ncbi:MAG: hypothetical protein AAF434_18135 [Pseudomonadota bacterium]
MSKFLVLVTSLIFALAAGAAAAHDGNPDNKLVASEAHGDWEIWCIDYGGAGDIRCNLNLVIIYKPRPDFRAMIPRIYVDGNTYRMEIDKEWQTSFSRGNLTFDGNNVVSLAECGSPCVASHGNPKLFFDLLVKSENAEITFHDYLVEEFTLNFPLDGLSTGINRLRELHSRYTP